MAYSDVWTNANDATFQGRCWAALWDVSNKVMEDVASYPSGPGNKKFAKLVLRDEVKLTPRQLTQQVLRNATIAASPATATDADIEYQLANNVWNTLKGIG